MRDEAVTTRRGLTGRRLAAAALLGMLALAGCGSSSNGSSSSGGTPSSASGASSAGATSTQASTPRKGLRLAFFQPTNTNEYTVIEVQGVRDAAKRYGASLDVFDSEYDGAKQANQIRQATSSGKYDGLVIMPSASPATICSAIQQALKAHIAVGMTNQPACSAAPTQAEYSHPYPGTSGFVGLQTPDLYAAWFRRGFQMNPGGGEFAVITGPALHENTPRQREALDSVKPQFPKWKEVGFVPGDYLPSTAQQQATTLLQQHPNLKLIFSTYSVMTQAILPAVRAAGKAGQVKIVDSIADESSFGWLKNGSAQLTDVALPYEEGYRGVQQIVGQLSHLKAVDGVPVGTFFDLTKDPKFKGLSPILTANQVSQYTALHLPESSSDPASLRVVNP